MKSLLGRMRVPCVLLLLIVWKSQAEDLTNESQVQDIVNIKLVPDTRKILNLKDVLARRVFLTRDCDELYHKGHTESGLYVIRPHGSIMIVVQCFMHDCGGWTIIQRNSINTELQWNLPWKTYKYVFGNMALDHWLGNYYIHLLTAQKWNKVKILLVDSKNITRYAEYDSIRVKDESGEYTLRLGTYSGDAGDSMTSASLQNIHDNMKFSAQDRDNDLSHRQNCANEDGGGWWYDACYDAQLNRRNGIHWATLCDHTCRNSVIMIRPVQMHCYRV